ncbi:hypothetical protein [Brucella sp.]|uniref:hypothetical protein n=1 Tax=Brucella sp. TaxID=52132 RepID=UPI00289D8300|nr:hypothetical protein [Brucella sp.]
MKKFGFGGERSFVVVIFALTIYCLLLGISIGAMFGAKPDENPPMGWAEYWLNRYQTLISGMVALGGVAAVANQVREARRHNLKSMRLTFANDIKAIQTAETVSGRYLRSFTSVVLSPPTPPTDDEREILSSINLPKLKKCFLLLDDIVNKKAVYPRRQGGIPSISQTIQSMANGFFSDTQLAAIDLRKAATEHQDYLRTFIPDL